MLNIRVQNDNDLDFLTRLLEIEANAPLAPAATTQEAYIFADNPSGRYAGAVIYRRRNTDESFAATEVLSQVDLDTLPRRGEFIEVILCWIHPDYRRLGLGRELLTHLEKAAHHNGIHLVYLQTGGKNVAGKQFARKMKYKEIFRGRIGDEPLKIGYMKKV